MAAQSLSEFYVSVCEKHQITTNPRVFEVLNEAINTQNVTVNLSGNNRRQHLHRLHDNDVLALSMCLRNNKCVTGLDIAYNNVTDEGAGHLAVLIQEENSALKSLDLRFNNIQADGAEALAESLQGNCSLRSLRLSGNVIGDRGATHLARSLQVNNTLQELQLDHCDLSVQSVMALIIMLKINKTLRCVDMSRLILFSYQEEWAVHLCAMLQVNKGIVALHLAKAGLSDTGAELLAEGLRLNCSLRYLDLRCNHLTQDGTRHLAEALKVNLTLEVIDLSANRIKDEGARYLSEAVSWPGSVLRGLSVCSNSIRTEGLLALAQALETNTTLTHIYIWGNELEEPVCQVFRDLMSRRCLLQTDVSSYDADGRVFLAHDFHRLRRNFNNGDPPRVLDQTQSPGQDLSPRPDSES